MTLSANPRKTLSANPRKRHPRFLGLGDRIERAIAKIPGVKKLPCYENGKLRPESGCGKAKARLNAGEPVIPTIIKRIKGE